MTSILDLAYAWLDSVLPQNDARGVVQLPPGGGSPGQLPDGPRGCLQEHLQVAGGLQQGGGPKSLGGAEGHRWTADQPRTAE